MKYRKKPIAVDAVKLPAEDEDASQELTDFLHAMDEEWESEKGGYLIIKTMEGNMSAKPGDWIIKGVQGEYYPCDAEVFAKSYDYAWDVTITKERWKALLNDLGLKLTLTDQEKADGWHWCWDWDGLLVNSHDKEGEGAACHCHE